MPSSLELGPCQPYITRDVLDALCDACLDATCEVTPTTECYEGCTTGIQVPVAPIDNVTPVTVDLQALAIGTVTIEVDDPSAVGVGAALQVFYNGGAPVPDSVFAWESSGCAFVILEWLVTAIVEVVPGQTYQISLDTSLVRGGLWSCWETKGVNTVSCSQTLGLGPSPLTAATSNVLFNALALESVQLDIVDSAIEWATNILWGLTGRIYNGECIATVRPCRDNRCDQYECCCRLHRIRLEEPICSIVEILIDGNVLDPLTYAIEDHRFLIRITEDGDREGWPGCQDLWAPSTDPDTFEITYTFGHQIPAEFELAAAELACEFIKGYSGEACKLPNGITSATSQGISLNLQTQQELIRDRSSDLPAVARLLAIYNPGAATEMTYVYSPDPEPDYTLHIIDPA